MRRKSDEGWTKALSQAEAARRNWHWIKASEKTRFPRGKGFATFSFDFAGCCDAVLTGRVLWNDVTASIRPISTIGLQFTERSNVAARVKKIRASEHFPHLLAAGWRLVVWGWSMEGSTPVLREDVVS